MKAVEADLAPATTLDLGCGSGQNSIWLARHGWVVLGIDFAEGAVETARATATEAGVTAGFDIELAELPVIHHSHGDDTRELSVARVVARQRGLRGG